MRTTAQWRKFFQGIFGSIHPKKIEEGKVVEQVKHDELGWKNRVRMTEKYIYARDGYDLVSAVKSEEDKISKANFLRGLRWIMEKYR